MLIRQLKNIVIFGSLLSLTACAPAIQPLGHIGPKKLGVYEISHNDFLSASRMVVILDKRGNVVAYSGGTNAGFGAVAMQTTGELVTAGAIVYGAHAIQKGLQTTTVNVKGIPKNVKVDANVNVNGNIFGKR